MDIDAIGKWVGIAKDVVIGATAASAAIFAYLGLSAWRKELKGKAEYELAKDVLKSVYRVRDGFSHVRHPAIYQYEYPPEMTNHTGHLDKEHRYQGTLHVYEKRMEVLNKAFQELEEHHLAAQVEWGSEFRTTIKSLRICRGELLEAVRGLLEPMKNPHKEYSTTLAQTREERSVLYEIGGDPIHDAFTLQINKAIDEFEKWLRPHIKKDG